jgi:predicted transcriptional regulator
MKRKNRNEFEMLIRVLIETKEEKPKYELMKKLYLNSRELQKYLDGLLSIGYLQKKPKGGSQDRFLYQITLKALENLPALRTSLNVFEEFKKYTK